MLGLYFTPACVLLSVCSLHFTHSLHFTPGPQSAVYALHWPITKQSKDHYHGEELRAPVKWLKLSLKNTKLEFIVTES